MDTTAVSQQLARAAFAWLRESGGIDGTKVPPDLVFHDDLLTPRIRWHGVTTQIQDAYAVHLDDESRADLAYYLRTAIAPFLAAAQDDTEIADSREEDAETARCRHEFQRPYLGGDDLPKQLQASIHDCACRLPGKIPIILLVQSKGFGKSRLLRELAFRSQGQPQGSMRVLYTCLTSDDRAAARFPQPTVRLCEYLFPGITMKTAGVGLRHWDYEGELVAKLLRLHAYAVAQWETVGHDWCSLFDGRDADASVCKCLHASSITTTTAATSSSSSKTPLTVIGDSAMILSLMRRRKPPKAPSLRPLFQQARRAAAALRVTGWHHHYRAHNKMADKAANLAMDARRSVQSFAHQARPELEALLPFLDNDVGPWAERLLQARRHQNRTDDANE